MNPYQFEVTCSVCGGTGVGTGRTAAAEWLTSYSVRHDDPAVCASILARKKAKLDKRETKLLEAETNGND